MTSQNSQAVAFVGATVATQDPQRSVHPALLITDGRVTAVGSEEEVRAASPAGTKFVDLGGRLVLPGFVDCHGHAIHRSLGNLTSPRLTGCRSVREVCDEVAKAVAVADEGDWIDCTAIGEPLEHCLMPGALAEGRWPTREDLDAVAPNNPVFIPTPPAWPNPAILNSRALEAVDLAESCTDPTIRCESDSSDGRPNGVIHGITFYNGQSRTFQRLMQLRPGRPQTQTEAAIAAGYEINLTFGVTSVYECHANTNVAELHALHDTGRLRNRVVATHDIRGYMPIEMIARSMAGFTDARGVGTGDDMFRMRGVMITLDGSTPFGKAHMSEPYLGPEGLTTGGSSVSAEKLTEIAQLAADNDLKFNVIGCGDQAIEIALTALRAVHSRCDLSGRGWSLHHPQYPNRGQVDEVAEMDLSVMTVASNDYHQGVSVFRDHMPGELWKTTTPMRWWFDAGVQVAQASDGAEPDPLFHIWASLTRRDGRTGEDLMSPAKQISREEALASWTINGAVVMGTDHLVGSLEPGKLADCVILDTNILTCDVESIPKAKTVATLLGGEVVYDPDGVLA